MPPVVSVIIVTYNPGAILATCLDSLPAAAGDLAIETFIVDNDSQDGTPDLIRTNYANVYLISNRDNRGFAAANNQALELSHGDYCLLLNPDVVAQPHTIAEMVRFLGQQPTAGIVGPRIFDADGTVALSARIPYTAPAILWQHLGFDRIFPNVFYGRYRKACQFATEPFDAAWLSGACLMIRRKVYEEIGGLEEHFFLFSEEPDYCDRAAKRGWRTMFVPSAQVTHYESTSVSRYPLVRIRSYHISPLYYFRKRSDVNSIILLKLGFTLELMLKSLVRLVQLFLQLLRGNDPQAGRMVRIYLRTLLDVWCFRLDNSL